MVIDPLPAVQDPSRLAALHNRNLLDTPAEEPFDRYTRLAQKITGAPVSLVTLVDRNRQWFKSAIGLPEPWNTLRETPLSHSFCQYPVATGRPLVVDDARQDPLVRDNLAIEALGVEAYLGFPLVTSDDHVLGSFCVIDSAPRDWTEEDMEVVRDLAASVMTEIGLRELVSDLQSAHAAAVEASRQKSDFLASMSHEIRTPMNVILGVSDLLVETPLNDDQRKYVSIFRDSGEVLLTLVNDILDLSKIEAGHLTLERVDFNLHEVLESTLSLMRLKIEARGLASALILHPAVSPWRHGDPHRLRQVLINLLNNAVKFTEEGGITLEVEPPQNDRLRFSVIDTGIGIPPDRQSAIFESFTQADDSTTRCYGGTGLGLTICRMLVEKMDGRIWVDSQPGEGSRFRFTARLDPVEAVPMATAPVPEAPRVRTLRILLADDAAENRLLLSAYFRGLPHEVDLVMNGEEALRQFMTRTYDVVLLDMEMPVMDGHQAARKMREWEAARGAPAVPILALTGNAFQEDVDRSLASGCTLHLAKPIRKAALLEAIARVTPAAEP